MMSSAEVSAMEKRIFYNWDLRMERWTGSKVSCLIEDMMYRGKNLQCVDRDKEFLDNPEHNRLYEYLFFHPKIIYLPIVNHKFIYKPLLKSCYNQMTEME